MKVNGPGTPGSIGQTPSRRPAQGGFSPTSAGSAMETGAVARASAAASVGSLDALLALQGAPDATERRRRAVRRAGRLLDVLDEVKLAMLDGAGAGAALERLRGAVREARDNVDDPGLEGVLNEIETRAAVELAKQDMARQAA